MTIMMDKITVQIPHEIAIDDGGVVPIKDFIDILMIVASSPFGNIGMSDVNKITSLANNSGHLSITLSSELEEWIAHDFIKIWNLLESNCEVEITVDTRG